MSKELLYYERDGKRYDRITSILDYFTPPDLVNWKLRVGKAQAGKISREARKIGTNVDECIRAWIRNDRLPKLKTTEAHNCWEAFIKWKQEYSIGAISEVPTVFNEELMIAGTPDIYLTEEAMIIDVKCAASIRPSYWLQVEFYGRMWRSEQKAVLRLNKNLGIYEFQKMSLSDEHWDAVRGLTAAYRYFKSVSEDGKGEEDECNSTSTAVSSANSAI